MLSNKKVMHYKNLKFVVLVQRINMSKLVTKAVTEQTLFINWSDILEIVVSKNNKKAKHSIHERNWQ